MQGYLACGFIASSWSITKRASLYLILLAFIISSLTNHSMQAHVHFQADGKESDSFYYLSFFSSYYGARL